MKNYFLLSILLPLISFNANAYYSNSSYNMDEISVDGQFQSYEPQRQQRQQAQPRQQQQPSQRDQLRSKRAQLEQQNERMVQQKIEDIRYQKELLLMKQMEETMNQTMKALENI